MKKYLYVMSVVLLTACLVILMIKLFSTQPIQIILDSGEQIINQDLSFYTMPDMLLMVLSSFFVGICSLYLYYNSQDIKTPIVTTKHEYMVELLKHDEKWLYQEIKNAGEILQSRLVIVTKLSKVKVARILQRLEMRNLIMRERYGLTNKVKITSSPKISD